MKKPDYLVDVPVAIVFFNRPELLKKTFGAIRASRPSKLFLIQDGPRDGNTSDLQKILTCREVVNEIDWRCDVKTNYSDVNLGCGSRVYSGISWAFNYVDRLVIIEDDCVPSLSFIQFAEALLEKYKNDTRIDMISGMNNLTKWNKTPYDYFFAQTGSIWGWATWKRVWESVDYNFGFVKDKDAERLITRLYGPSLYKKSKKMCSRLESGEKLSSWSLQRGMNMFLNSGLIIVPRNNLVSNIGLAEGGTNSSDYIKKVPRGLRKIFFMKTFEIDFPLAHPKYVINDQEFNEKIDRLMGNGHPLVKSYRKVESIIYRLYYGDYKGLLVALKRRIRF